LEKGYYQPTTYFITELLRIASRGGVPGNNAFMDFIYWVGSGVSLFYP
jgi:3-dehydrosphinganine reductase